MRSCHATVFIDTSANIDVEQQHKALAPTKMFFDCFNPSSTGHQRAKNRLSGSTSWRDSRTCKLADQFQDSSGRGARQHLSDLTGAGCKDYGKDGRKEDGDWEKGIPGLRESCWQDMRDLMSGPRKRTLDEAVDSNSLKKSKSASAPSVEQPHQRDTRVSTAKPQGLEEHDADT